jgi:alpha-galactosidase
MAPMNRRDLLRMALAGPLAALSRPALDLDRVKKAPARVRLPGGAPAGGGLRVERSWAGPLCRSRLVNEGQATARVGEIVLFDVAHGLAADTPLYGEGFQMLSQTGGTLARPVDLGNYTDAKHYRLPAPADATVAYGLIRLGGTVVAFTSCRRFNGRFHVRPSSLEVVIDAEGLEIAPGESWPLEDLIVLAGADPEALLAEVARRIAESHPPLAFAAPPSGWCSWYCFGPRVTAEQVLANLDVIARRVPGLKYIQIDDGYQPAMGDWLETGSAFGGDVQGVLKAIRARGFEPAIWVAPFIAEKESRLFREHPDWLVQDEHGAPLAADRVTFGGWRRGPWFAVDGTHPEARRHLEGVFRTMREEWGCTYFKLDANFWGAIHGGRFHDARASRIEAYRRGMEAVRRGAGDAFLLGCNHPIWPSLGLVHGSRSSNDIKRSWDRFATTAVQNLRRNWQNGRLWWNDPDAVVLSGDLTEEERRFHATAVHATGGMLLSGDDLTKIPDDRLEMLRKLQPPTRVAARFADESLEVGVAELPDRRLVFLLNRADEVRAISFRLPRPCHVRELWTGEDLGRRSGEVGMTLPARSGRVLVCAPP